MSYLNIKANMPLPGQVCFISSICRSRCSLNFSINLTFEKQKLNSTFTQSWQCGVAKKVSKCSKHSYISMSIWLIKDRLKLTSVLGVTTIRSLSCEQMQVWKHERPTNPSSNVVFFRLSPWAQLLSKCFNNFSCWFKLKSVASSVPLMNYVTTRGLWEEKSSITN